MRKYMPTLLGTVTAVVVATAWAHWGMTRAIATKPMATWTPIVNPIDTGSGFVPGLYRTETPDAICFLAYGLWTDQLSCVPR